MLEGLVAGILNAWLGKFVEDLDAESLNVGIFSGDVQLQNLKLKSTCLLPLEVKNGMIGEVRLTIPWTSMTNKPITATIQDVFLVAHPVGYLPFDAERDKQLMRGLKRRVIERLENVVGDAMGGRDLVQDLLSALGQTFQVHVRNVHVRIEDPRMGVAAGICIQEFSVETTNNKWKPLTTQSSVRSVYQLVRVEALSMYLNVGLNASQCLGEEEVSVWLQGMRSALMQFQVKGTPLDFFVKPFNAKLKLIAGKTTESPVLIDVVVQDAVVSMSKAQLLALLAMSDLIDRIPRHRKYLAIRPRVPVSGHSSAWWKYAVRATIDQRILPYSWARVFAHRKSYRQYKELYKQVVARPNDSELRLDLQRCEDSLPLSSIVIAREQAKLEIREKQPELVDLVESGIGSKHYKLDVRRQLSTSSDTAPILHFMEHKLNVTIDNLSVTLLRGGREVLAMSLSHCLGSFEARSPSSYKISARAGSVVVEGASIDHELVPLISTPTDSSAPAGNTPHTCFSIDFEKNPQKTTADYAVAFTLTPIEIIYHEHAISELLSWVQGSRDTLCGWCGAGANFMQKQLPAFIAQRPRLDLSASIVAPRIILPESGSLQKGGMVLVLDLGKWDVHTELQPPLGLDDIADITQMELEERLYHRLHVNCSALQILFSDSGEEWREKARLEDSDVHVVSRVRGQIVLSTSVKPEYRLLPRTKLNVAFASLQLSLSDRRVELLLDFIEGVPRPCTRSVSYVPPEPAPLSTNDTVRKELSVKEFRQLKNTIISLELYRQRTPSEIISHVSSASIGDLPDLIRSVGSIDVSDEEAELWARTLDLPGFEDNVSPHNTITALYRITLAEVVLHVPKGVRHQDKPYLMARLSRLSLDVAVMQYGPAVQISLGGAQLIDKLHIGPCGEYLEVLSTQSDLDFFSLLYRKVRADCPDFKSHFHSVEQSVVVDVGCLALVFHREAMRSIRKFLEHLKTKVEERPLWALIPAGWFEFRSFSTTDPPVPPGATKFSYSTYLSELRVRLREVDSDILELKACGLQSDCTYRADERLVLRVDINKFSVDELGDGTLYPKIVAQDEDKVLELKLVHLSSGARHGEKNNLSVGSLKLTLGRLHVLFAAHTCHALQRMSEPFSGQMIQTAWKLMSSNLQVFPKWGETLQLSLNLHLPTMLLPPGAASPSLLILNLGNLTVENFLKQAPSSGIVDNILLKLENSFITRGLMTLAGSLESQEEIMDPMQVTLDVKRTVIGCYTAQIDAAGSIDIVKLAIGQRDLALILEIWAEHRTRTAFQDLFARLQGNEENAEMRSLQAFLSGADSKRRDTAARFSIDAVTIVFYTDMDELLSSPVRDMNHAFCRFHIQDIVLFAETRPSGVCEVKLSIHNCNLDDIRTEAGLIVKRVFYARPGGDGKLDSAISVSTPPLVDVMMKQSARGDRCIDILVEKTRANLSASFLAAVVNFLCAATPLVGFDGGVVNHGYVADTIRKVSTSNCTDHHELSDVERDRGLSLSVQLRRPEVALLEAGGSGLVCRCEGLLDWSRCPGRNELVLRMAGLRVTSKTPGPMVMRPCDVEIVWNAANSGVTITAGVSPLDITISTSTAAVLSNLLEEMKVMMTFEKKEPQTPINALSHVLELEDIWSPKKMVDSFNFDTCVAVTEPSQGEPHSFPVCSPAENLTVSVGKVTVVLGHQNGNLCNPLFVVKSSFRLSAHDWSSVLHLSAELQLNAGCWNSSLNVWEPFMEPWTLELQIFQGKALPISPRGGKQATRRRRTPDLPKPPEGSDTSGDESEHGMTFLRPDHYDVAHEVRKAPDSLIDSSDSEAEDGAFERLLDSVSDLFAGDPGSSGDEGSSSELEVETETASTGSTRSAATERAVFFNKHTDSVDSGLETEAVERLATHVLLHSKQRLEISITSATLHTLNLLNNIPLHTAPRLLANHLGPSSEITLIHQGEVLATSKFDEESPVSTPGSLSRSPSPSPDSTSEDPWDNGRISPDLDYHRESLEGLQERVRGSLIKIEMEGLEPLQVAVGKCVDEKIFSLSPPRRGISYSAVIATKLTDTVVHYIVSGPLQIKNESSYPVGIYYKKSVLTSMGEAPLGESTNPFDDLTRLALVAPDDSYYVPLAVCYHCTLYFLPGHLSNHNVSLEGVSWNDLSALSEGEQDISCLSKDGAVESVFSLRVSWSPQPGPARTLKICSPCVLRNLLPCACEFSIPGATRHRLEAGEEGNVYQINLLDTNLITIDVPEYMGLPWSGSFSLTPECKDKSVTFTPQQDTESGNKQLSLSVSIVRSDRLSLILYSPYWLLNKTGLSLQIRGSGSDVVHEWVGSNPLLFCYRKQRARSVRLRVLNSSWSSAFSIDPVGCSGLVICRDRERRKRYRIIVQCEASTVNPALCKILTFLPHLLVENGCKKHLRFMEDNERADLWNDIAPGQCVPFWPDTDSLRMVVRLRDSKHISPIFPVYTPHVTALRMDKGCGLTVVVSGGSDGPLRVLFRPYQVGDAPVRVDNQCADLFLKLHQKDCPQVALLSPYQSLLYTWDDACKDRVLLWSVYNNKGREIAVQLSRDDWGEERVSFRSVRKRSRSSSASSDSETELTPNANVLKETRKDKVVVYWVSFLQSRQRVLLLTQDERLARRARRAMEAERSSLELFLSLPGCGLSLSHEDLDGALREIAYFSLNEGAAEWEVAVAQRWKQVSLELASWLENNYIRGVAQPQIKDYIHVDLNKMIITKPLFGELRRRQRAAIWVQYRLSRHMSVLQAYIHRVQIDDQRLDADMPTVLHAAASARNRPAVELTILRKHGRPGEDVAKFGSLLIVEHVLRIDWPWLMEILATLTQWSSIESLQANMRRDIALLHSPVVTSRKEEVSGEHVMVEHLQCSDLVVDLTLAPNPARVPADCDWPIPKVFSALINTAAPAATPINNLSIKLFGMEVDGNGCDFISLRDRIASHYLSQILQQFHVLVVGVNVLTNPRARLALRPLASIDGAMLPEEFSDVVSAGVEGILGLDVGASANASVLLGTAATQNAAVRSQICADPTAPPGVWNCAHSYPHGCSLGVSGVTMLPARGAPCSGLDGFYRGTGRGVMGLLSKTAARVPDPLAMTLDAITRASSMGESIYRRSRPPRYVNPIMGLRPYSIVEAQGVCLLQSVCRGHYNMDVYWGHASLSASFTPILLVTLQRVLLIEKVGSSAKLDATWTERLESIISVSSVDLYLLFTIRQAAEVIEKKFLFRDEAVLSWLHLRIKEALLVSTNY